MNYMTAPAIISDNHGLIDFAKIIKLTADYFQVNRHKMISSDRHRELAEARHYCMHYLHVSKRQTLTTIGRVMGGRDHTTILYGVNNIRTQVKLQESWKDTLYEYTSFINQNI
jgi:chromosomal replication initiator protein